ncbi:MAG: tripartite tricarboxylate transporter substrate binding protein [Betaproteobacteria bacterium]|nr:tripartite tricarboxylate transporter substrate binding protein [Betaproteobacteria bacterium]
MKNRAPWFHVVLAATILTTVATNALPQTTTEITSQAYPIKPIRLIVPYVVGSGSSILARAVGQKLGESFNQPVVVDNRSGASGILGTTMVAKAAPDGYTLLFPSAAHTILASYFDDLPYDTVKDFAPVTQVSALLYVLSVHSAVAAKSVKELITLAKSKPGELNYGSGVNGGAPHLAGELLKNLAGINIVQVPYSGGVRAVAALMSGEVQILFSVLATTLPHINAGKIRSLAVSGAKRSPAAPELPTVAESGVPGFDVTTWYGVLAPAKTPKPIIDRLHVEIVRALNTPGLKVLLMNDGQESVGSTPDTFAIHIKAEVAKWAKLIGATGMRADKSY